MRLLLRPIKAPSLGRVAREDTEAAAEAVVAQQFQNLVIMPISTQEETVEKAAKAATVRTALS